MACGNTLTPGDAEIVRSSRTEPSQPQPSQAIDGKTECEPIERSLPKDGKLVVPDTAEVLGIDQDRVKELNSRAEDWTKGQRAALAEVTDEHPQLTAQIVEALGSAGRPPEMTARMVDALWVHLKGRSLKDQPGFAKTADPERGKGQTSLLDTCARQNPRHAKGFGYELIMSATVRENGIKGIEVESKDHISFGQKAQASIGRKQIDGWGSDKETCEADQLITKPDGYSIGIDFKYRSERKSERDGDKSSPYTYLPEKTLNAYVAAIQSGEINEIHFVTNVKFAPATEKLVAKLNSRLDADQQANDQDLIRTEDLSGDEREALEKKTGTRIVLHEQEDWR